MSSTLKIIQWKMLRDSSSSANRLATRSINNICKSARRARVRGVLGSAADHRIGVQLSNRPAIYSVCTACLIYSDFATHHRALHLIIEHALRT